MKQPLSLFTQRVIATCSIAFCLLFVWSFKKTKPLTFRSVDPAFSAYIYAYSSGELGRRSPIRVRFTESVASRSVIGTEVARAVFSLSPTVAGKAVWEDANTIQFTPSEPLKGSELYTATVHLDAIFKNVPARFATFDWDFRAKAQTITVTTDGFTTPNSNDYAKATYKGAVHTADYAEDKAVEAALECLQTNNSSLKTTWKHDSDHRNHQFNIENITRSATKSELKLWWNGQGIDSEQKGDKTVEVAAINTFKLLDVAMNSDDDGGSPHAILQFSDPLKPEQNLDGLLTVNGQTLSASVSGNNLLVYAPSALQNAEKASNNYDDYSSYNNEKATFSSLQVHAGIKNTKDSVLRTETNWALAFGEGKPAIRPVGKGVIIPNSSDLLFPFDATQLNAVDVEIFKISQANVVHFLQENQLDGANEYQMRYFGTIVFQRKINLDELAASNQNGRWTRYALDLKEFVKNEPGAIYQVRIGYRRRYAVCNCSGTGGNGAALPKGMSNFGGKIATNDEGESISILDYSYREGENSYDEGDNTSYDDKDPCRPSYYNSRRFIVRNVLATDLAMIAKRGSDGSLTAAVTKISTTDPVPNVRLTWCDLSGSILATATTDADGFATATAARRPSFLLASIDKECSYLKLEDGYANSLSKFNVDGGERHRDGLNGFLYGERGVWRPGDSLFLTFMLQDKSRFLPNGESAENLSFLDKVLGKNKSQASANTINDTPHPVTLELYDPQGKLHRRVVKVSNEHGLYDFRTATDPSAQTGAWEARVSVGNASFSKTIKIETVKPNRLKIKLDWGKPTLSISDIDSSLQGKLSVAWLHGAVAKSLNADVQMTLSPAATTFPNYKEYNFIDPTKIYNPEPTLLFDAQLSPEGNAAVPFVPSFDDAPGLLQARFYVRAFEKGGDMSFNNFYLPVSPYKAYVGIKPPSVQGYAALNILKDNAIELATVTENGKPAANNQLAVHVYRLTWSWWWDSREEGSISGFRSNTHHDSVDYKNLQTNAAGKAIYTFKPKEWGRYLILVEDKTTGHSTGSILYTEYKRNKGFEGNNDEAEAENPREAAAKLIVATDKDSYKTTENITLTVPTGESGRVLISLENGSHVVRQFWAIPTKGETKVTFAATPEMAPTIYAHVTYIQPHAQVQNDLPIRLYGAIPIAIENPDAHLNPQLQLPATVRPDEPFAIKIKERSGKAMAYTVDIVDEGLLDLTGFQTPNPYKVFYEKEALGVKTWDVYDYVLGAFGSSIQHILSLGGDEANAKAKGRKANRFKPAVVHLGPYYLPAGSTTTHNVVIPNYVGSVRVMVVAAQQGATAAYGASDTTLTVQKPLMLLATAPRVLSPDETVKLPVDIFAMTPNVKNVHISLAANDCFEIVGESNRNLQFTKAGDETVTFDLKVKQKIGIGKITVIATGNGEVAKQEIELDVRNPNPQVTEVKEAVIQANSNWEQAWEQLGVEGTNSGVLELSTLPSINLEQRLNYLITYPHGCIEQTTSGAFPQLYVGKLTPLTKAQETEIAENIKSVLLTLRHFQTPDGAFGYWEGDRYANEWGTNYAGHFLLDAQAQGYVLPPNMLENWVGYQQRAAKTWSQMQNLSALNHVFQSNYADQEQVSQAYRLYTLALANKPENGAMNRLVETVGLCKAAKWRLAAAFAVIGKQDIATKLTKDLDWNIAAYRDMGGTFGSDLRDQAMILETLTLLRDQTRSAIVAKEIAQKLGKTNEWYSTQTTAYALLALAKYASGTAFGSMDFTYQLTEGAKLQAPSTKLPLVSIPIENIDKNTFKKILLENKGKGILFARLILSGKPAIGKETDFASNMNLRVIYRSLKGDTINVKALPQGTDFMAEITVTNPGKRGSYEQLAVSQIFPSGWEIHNARLMAAGSNAIEEQSAYTYRDVRDDRVNTYFNLLPMKSVTYRVQLNAAYQGKYYLPATVCEAMYDAAVSARQKGSWVEVLPDEGRVSMR